MPKPAPSPDGRPSTKPKKPKFHKKTGSVKDPGIVKLKNLFNEFGDRQLFTGTAGVSFNIFSQKKIKSEMGGRVQLVQYYVTWI